MLFLLDECIPESALRALVEMNFQAEMITDHIAPQSPDQLVAATASAAGAIIVSHDRDFKKIISRRPNGQQARYPNAHLVKMECKQPRIADRLRMSMPLIQSKFTARQGMRDRRMILWIKTDMVTVWR